MQNLIEINFYTHVTVHQKESKLCQVHGCCQTIIPIGSSLINLIIECNFFDLFCIKLIFDKVILHYNRISESLCRSKHFFRGEQMHIQNPAKHLCRSFNEKIVIHIFWPSTILAKNLHHKWLTGSAVSYEFGQI